MISIVLIFLVNKHKFILISHYDRYVSIKITILSLSHQAIQILHHSIVNLLKHFCHDFTELMESVVVDWVHQLNRRDNNKISCFLFDLQQHLRKHFEFIVEFFDEQASFEVSGALEHWAEQSLNNVKALSDLSVVGDLVLLAL